MEFKELKKFLEKFLPEYDVKLAYMTNEFTATGQRLTKQAKEYLLQKMIDKYFPEALQNFADRICEEQRINCASERCVIDGEYDERLILNAEQPKIEEL